MTTIQHPYDNTVCPAPRTITENLGLFHAHRRRNTQLEIALRFFNTRLKQIKRQIRRENLRLFALILRRLFIRK